MKLRIHRNSLRFRLSPTDVQRLDDIGAISEKAEFAPGAEFCFTLRTRSTIHDIRAVLDPNSICVEIPTTTMSEWRNSDTVGMHHSQPLENGSTLEILVEKDFECLHGDSTGSSEPLYPNPGQAGDAR